MNTQHPSAAPLLQLRGMLESMSVATFNSIDEHGALFSSRLSRWEIDDWGALWFFTDPLCLPAAYLPSVNLSFTDEARTTCVSLSGRGQLYLEGSTPEYLRGAIALGQINAPRFIAQAHLSHQALLKFMPQSAAYWQAPPSLVGRLLALLFGRKAAPLTPAMHCIDLPSGWELDAPQSST